MIFMGRWEGKGYGILKAVIPEWRVHAMCIKGEEVQKTGEEGEVMGLEWIKSLMDEVSEFTTW